MPVELDYNDLVNEVDLFEQIEEAYGSGTTALGVLTVKNVPGLVAARERLLRQAFLLGNLPKAVQAKYEHPESNYSFGWSHGKEKLDGKLDVSKGSFYANPQYDTPSNDAELIKKYISFIHPNIWPTADLPELEPAFKELGQIIVAVGKLIAKQCDRYIASKCATYSGNRLEKTVEESICCKARLLHYYPFNETSAADVKDSNSFSSWCGWHNDHGSITGLVSAIYMDSTGIPVQNVDPNSGLFICNRQGEIVKVSIPSDHIAYQIGETAQVHSGGILQATPHAVRGTSQVGVSRETFAVFMEPNFGEAMNCPAGIDPVTAQSQSSAKNLPPGVPSLASRWNTNQDFNDFTIATLSSYY